MKKIKEINSIVTHHCCGYKNVELSFFNKLHRQCSSKHIEFIDEFWFVNWLFRILWDLYIKNELVFIL